MSKQITDEQEQLEVDREAVDIYHRQLMGLIHIVRLWTQDKKDLREFLDHNGDLISEPKDFRMFREALETALEAGTAANLYQDYYDQRKMKIIAKALLSEPRTRYYSGVINDRLRRKATESVNPVSLLELEQRYQHYLYKRGRDHQKLGLGPVFRTWIKTPNCQTFYDDFDLKFF